FLNSGVFLVDSVVTFGGLVAKSLNPIRYHRKPFTRLSSPGGFDGCVECQKIRLLRDGRDDLNDFADFRAGLTQFADSCVGGPGGFYCFSSYTSSLAGVLRNLING